MANPSWQEVQGMSRSVPAFDAGLIQADRRPSHQEDCQRLEKALFAVHENLNQIAGDGPMPNATSDQVGFVATIERCIILANALGARVNELAVRLGHE